MASSSLNLLLLFLVWFGLIYTKLVISASSALSPVLSYQGAGRPHSLGTRVQAGGAGTDTCLSGPCYKGLEGSVSRVSKSHWPLPGRDLGTPEQDTLLGFLTCGSHTHGCGRAGTLSGNCTRQHAPSTAFCFCYFSRAILALVCSRSWLWFAFDFSR